MLFVACRAVLWSLSCLALFKMLVTGGVLDRLLFQMQMLSSVQACTENQILLFQYFDVCGFGCVKKVNPLCTKFEISSCFAYNEKISFVEEIFPKFPHILIFENSQSNSLLLFTNLLYE